MFGLFRKVEDKPDRHHELMRIFEVSRAKIDENYSLCQSYRQVEIAFFSAIVTAASIFVSTQNDGKSAKEESDIFLVNCAVYIAKQIDEDAKLIFDQLLMRWKLYVSPIHDCLRKGGPGSLFNISEVTTLLDKQVIHVGIEDEDRAETYAKARGQGVEWSMFETVSAVSALYR